MTEKPSIRELGEFGLIRHLTGDLKMVQPETRLGVGDDAAVCEYGNSKVLITTDLLTEGVHFDLIYTPLKHLGYKAVAVNLSDICAMNGTPKQITIAIAISAKFTTEMMDELYAGIKLACEKYQVDLIGGDTSSSMTGMTLAVTAIGTAQEDTITYRNGALENDIICVSGDLGAAYMGLLLLEREKRVLRDNQITQPDFEGNEYLLERFLKPEPRKDIVDILKEKNVIPTSMIDISDGLSSEILHLCQQSNKGAKIYEEKIPIDLVTQQLAEKMNIIQTTAALNGGEDYELLFTIRPSDYEKIKGESKITAIGHITPASAGCYLITTGDSAIELKAQGWNPLA